MKIKILTILIIILLFPVTKGYCEQKKLFGLEIVNYFSSDYGEARRKFLDASHSAGADIESFKNPHVGPEGEALFTDIALIGPRDASTIIVLGSGTHGVEGFAGSAIQTGLLSEGIISAKKSGVRFILIHAINPYGFAHLRRFNEDNIDINRNFADSSKPYPANPGYEELSEAISPESISLWANIKAIFKLLQYQTINGKADLKKAISQGQYTHPEGLFYGGQNKTWSNRTIRKIIKRYLSNAERVIYIDIHTGLGTYSSARIIFQEKEDSPAYKRAVDLWGDKVQNTFSGKSDSVYIPSTVKSVFSDILPEIEVTGVTLEFGTLSSLKVFWALRSENWLYHHGKGDHPDADNIKTDLFRAFYPDDDDWKHQVWIQGKEVVINVLNQLYPKKINGGEI